MVVPLNKKTGNNLRPALEQAFKHKGNKKPEMMHTDAETGLTGKATQ